MHFFFFSFFPQIGRRFLFLLAQGGALLGSVLACFAIRLDLSLWFICLAHVIDGCCGGVSSMLLAVFSASSDQHTGELQGMVVEKEKKKKKKKDDEEEKSPSNPANVVAVGFKSLSKNSNAGGKRMIVATAEGPGGVKRLPNEDTRVAKETTLRDDAEGSNHDSFGEEDAASERHGTSPAAVPDGSHYDKNRGVRILAIECYFILIRGCVMLGSGYFIKDTGYFYPVLTASVIFLLALVFTYFFVQNPESQIIAVKDKRNVLEPLKIVYRSVRSDSRKLSNFILCNLAFMVIVFCDGGLFRTVIVIQMSPPFCYTSVEIGWYTGEKFSIIMLSVPLLVGLKKLSLQEATMAGIGICINSLADVLYFFVNDWYYIFFVGEYRVSE